MGKFSLKATPTDNGNSIILSFDSKWDAALRNSMVSVVFRKTGPTRFLPTYMYIYLNAPISAIIGGFPITRIENLSVEDAVKAASAGGLTENEIRAYAATAFGKSYSVLVAYYVGRLQLATSPITQQYLKSKYGFWPSPSFIPLSMTGKATLDRLGDFPA
jgi:predicted transcriptional regulator